MAKSYCVKLKEDNELIKTSGVILRFIFDLLFPVFCLGCGKEEEWICSDCLKKIKEDKNVYHRRYCKKIIAVGAYDDELLKKAIQTFKYKFVFEMSKPLGKLLKGALGKQQLIAIPIPLSKKRLLWRGFNQAELLAKELGRPVLTDALIKRRERSPQVKLGAIERRLNVKNTFLAINKEKIVGKRLLLVDDVMTTGATLDECARVLKEAGAKEVWGLVLAKEA